MKALTSWVLVVEQKMAKMEEDMVIEKNAERNTTFTLGDLRAQSDAIIKCKAAIEKRLEATGNAVRSSNLRILGIPALAEGDDIVAFLGTFLTAIFEVEGGKGPPLVIRAYRLPTRSRNWGENGAGTVLVTLADVTERVKVARTVQERETTDL